MVVESTASGSFAVEDELIIFVEEDSKCPIISVGFILFSRPIKEQNAMVWGFCTGFAYLKRIRSRKNGK